MKKAVSLIFTFLMLFTFALSVNAEEFNGADLFTIDLPEEFQHNEASSSDFSFENVDGDTVTVTYNDNTFEDKGQPISTPPVVSLLTNTKAW